MGQLILAASNLGNMHEETSNIPKATAMNEEARRRDVHAEENACLTTLVETTFGQEEVFLDFVVKESCGG